MVGAALDDAKTQRRDINRLDTAQFGELLLQNAQAQSQRTRNLESARRDQDRS